ncbi:protein kinase domain-containing protein [Cellulomonas uda]|uniref:non-specific serine/threonine protein kinase n=1 Tax=Cellulomonas uda TaxID=1714 RepID=A0A4Y3KA39_CELUD|nr:protein kinase [Cellulomonas uda]NII67577.1 serine/threonine protein kinase [Cellulomonas uda]GEA81341.1 hypothetical protein CUD01_17850 [Cellulomonas uda]
MGSEADLFVGRTLSGRWHVVKEIGGGGFGMVFAAQDLVDGREVAVKMLRLTSSSDPAARTEFDDEARFLERLRECNCVVDLLDKGEDIQILSAEGPSGKVDIPWNFRFMVLELADGCLTQLLLLDEATFAWRERLGVFRDVVKGVHQMHLKQVVDRDLKSENVLVFATSGSAVAAKVADLGRARLMTEPPRFQSGEYLVGRGDLRFAAPELLWHQGHDSDFDWRAVDLYHLGSVLFELGTGVGITSSVLPDSLAILQTMYTRPDAERAASFRRSLPELADRYELAADLFVAAAPAAIRPQLASLLRQLVNPSPPQRFPKVQGVSDTRPGLGWLLRRIDVLVLTLVNADREARRQLLRKATS